MALSQMMQHYLEVKDKYKDCVIFYRLGDFYEMFFEDAEKVSKLLDLTLTGRDCGLEKRAPMCGVPYHAADNYIAKLVSLGEKVAICEQLEDPSTVARGNMVARDVIRVVTAGTLTDEKQLDERSSSYICSVYLNSDAVSLAWADITTGEFNATDFYGGDAVDQAVVYMVKLAVKEIICNDDMLFACKNKPEVTRNVLPKFSSYPAYAFMYATAENCLKEQFNAKTLSAFSISGHNGAVSAAGALIDYLKDTQKHALKNIDGVRYISNSAFMKLDTSAIKNLELVKTLSENKRYGSLLWLLDKTKTGMGARLMNTTILSPLCDKDKINYRLDGVEEFYNAPVIMLSVSELLSEIKDIERLSGKISNGNITPRDCIALARSLEVIPNIRMQLAGFTSKALSDVSARLYDLSSVAELINNAIVPENTPVVTKDGGYIKSGYNAKLDELRNIKDNGKDIILRIESRERDATGIRTLKINYNRVFGYYIEVTKSFKDKVPLNYQRRQTLANSERYTTEELKEVEEKILNSEDMALKLEASIFDEIKEVLASNINNLKVISGAIAALDMYVSFAQVAKTYRYVRPKIVESDKPLVIKEGRHPVVERISKERFIANDTLLDENENRTMIITGPNMAGKSTYMRQTALITLMAHLGCFVPAKYAEIPITDRIFTRIGASDNLISDQSTFMVEMIEVASILQNATKSSLLILDEVGRGTSTYDGLSIAWAVIESLTQKIGAKTMFATHYHELTELENRMEGVKNYKISVKEVNGDIVFMRKIMRGGANRSFGIEVASLAGVPKDVTDRAKQILKLVERKDKIASKKQPAEEEEQKEYSEVERILMQTDMNNLSPMQAFIVLSDLVEKVKTQADERN
ncbi:MAG: DNA mismatch repair protein MutS [Clostridia bacterium]|nr:DNA mismatch repair protein MutS [Clostridia bacterium]